jgi:3-oxoadipate enol-lactonase
VVGPAAAHPALTLLVSGGPASHIPGWQATALANRIPDCRLVTIPAGQEVHANAPAEFLAAVREFLG